MYTVVGAQGPEASNYIVASDSRDNFPHYATNTSHLPADTCSQLQVNFGQRSRVELSEACCCLHGHLAEFHSVPVLASHGRLQQVRAVCARSLS